MATFFTDFSEYTTGVAPADWTARWNTSNVTYTVQEVVGALGGKVLRAVVTTLGRHAISWDDVGTPGTTEILMKMRLTAITDGVTNQGPAGRGSGSGGSETGYTVAIMDADFLVGAQQLSRYSAGAFSGLASGTDDFAVNTWEWCRYQISGSTHTARFWTDGDSEPLASISHSDATHATGWAGILAASVATHEFDYFAVGTDGDPAPSPVVAAASSVGLMLMGVG